MRWSLSVYSLAKRPCSCGCFAKESTWTIYSLSVFSRIISRRVTFICLAGVSSSKLFFCQIDGRTTIDSVFSIFSFGQQAFLSDWHSVGASSWHGKNPIEGKPDAFWSIRLNKSRRDPSSHCRCFNNYMHLKYYWIIDGPRYAVMIVRSIDCASSPARRRFSVAV